MICDEARPLLPAYLAEEVAGRQKTRLKKHLQGCEDCRNILTGLKKTTAPSKDLPKAESAQDLPGRTAEKTRLFKLPLAALVILLIAGLAVYLAFLPSPSNKPIPEFRLLSEKPVQAEKAVRDLVELLDGTMLPKKDAGRIVTPAAPTAAGISEEDILLISIPTDAQDFFLEKLRALGALEPVPPAGQQIGEKQQHSNTVALRLIIAPQK